MRKSYSYSKRQTLESCARKFFYEYYAAGAATPFDPERKPQVAACKAMGSLPAEAGRIVHSMIRVFLGKHPDWGSSWFLKTAAANFDRNVAYSRDPVRLAAQMAALTVLSISGRRQVTGASRLLTGRRARSESHRTVCNWRSMAYGRFSRRTFLWSASLYERCFSVMADCRQSRRG